MKHSSLRCRRLILGMSVEDAQSKFDSAESRSILRVAHERYNQGVYHELQVAQRLRNKLPPERKCHICRYTKPSVKGFQAYMKSTPEDYVVKEVWPSQKPDTNMSTVITTSETPEKIVINVDAGTGSQPREEGHGGNTVVATISSKITSERQQFKTSKKTVLTTLSNALEVVKDNVVAELSERRQSGTLTTGQQQSVIDRLVEEVSEGNEKGYKSLSSSTHLLDPVEMTLTLFAKKEKDVAEAFLNPLLFFPAREGDVSYSLWVAGGLIADEHLCTEFPFHLAKYVVSESGAYNSNRLPRAHIEVYFSAELYHLQKSIGSSGVTMLRQFIGETMKKQHEPTPVSSSILLNVAADEKRQYNVSCSGFSEGIRVPWVQAKKLKVSTLTGVVFSTEEDEDNALAEAKKEAMSLVWRAWGHFIKDLHVHGDLDFLYVSINRQQEVEENREYINDVKAIESSKENSGDAEETSLQPIAQNRRGGGGAKTQRNEKKARYVPIATDFVVIECVLERRGLSHNLVIEDIVETLSNIQSESLEMLRLAMMDELEGLENVDVTTIVPLFYAPKISVSHAGVIENGTHSFQRVRIRGSSLAHVEALARSLGGGQHFTDRTMPGPGPQSSPNASTVTLLLPPNLSFSATHSLEYVDNRAQGNRLVGNRISEATSSAARANAGRYERHQEMQIFDYMTVSAEEREFWREHYYRLSELQVVFHDRVDPDDALSGGSLNPRLQAHIKTVFSKITGEEGEDEEVVAEIDKTQLKRKKSKQKKKKTVDTRSLPPEKIFEYLCTDMEAECAQYDLRVGDCLGHKYAIKLRRIPSKDVELVTPALRSVRNKGFINYFGTSRFATYTRMNMHPGLHLLKGEFHAAAHIIVQQFYLDAAIQAERHRTGSAFPKLLTMGGSGYHLSDFMKGARRRSVAEHGTALQKVLNNALEASTLLQSGSDGASTTIDGIRGVGGGSGATGDPCAEAFLNVIGPNACRIIVHEFLSFVWNEVVNQRLQRYGTFAILPGDLVRPGGALSRDHATNAVVRASKRDITSGKYTHWDVLLPIPGARVELPDNHTADLYVVTLKRYGLQFNPELRQWGCFYGRAGAGTGEGKQTAVGAAHFSPYRMLAPSFTAMEQELTVLTPYHESLGSRALTTVPSSSLSFDDADGAADQAAMDASALREDVRVQLGNPSALWIDAAYRHPIACQGLSLHSHLEAGEPGDPYQRWSANFAKRLALGSGGKTSFMLGAGGSGGTHRQELSRSDAGRPKGFYKRLPLPDRPYWVSQNNNACLELKFELPCGVYPNMIFRELMKMDVNTPDVVDLDRPVVDLRAKSWESLSADQQATYKKFLAKRQKRVYSSQPRAVSLALLHQQIFRSGGVRHSLIPTLRSYDSVSK